MRTFLLSLAITLAVAASVIVIIERLSPRGGPDQRALREALSRLERIEKRFLEEPDPAAMADAASGSGSGARTADTLARDGDRLSELKTLVEEVQEMLLDMDRDQRRALKGMYERLVERIDEISTSAPSGGAGAGSVAQREAVLTKLKSLGVELDLDAKMAMVKAEVGAPTQVLELVASAPGGRLHESLLVMNVTPGALKLAIEMLDIPEVEFDFENGKWPEGAKGVYCYVRWEGLKKPRRLETMLWNTKERDTMRHTPFMFTASYMETDSSNWERYLAADVYKHVISLTLKYASPSILCCPLPEAAVEDYWVPFDRNPEAGTEIDVIFLAEPNPKWDQLR